MNTYEIMYPMGQDVVEADEYVVSADGSTVTFNNLYFKTYTPPTPQEYGIKFYTSGGAPAPYTMTEKRVVATYRHWSKIKLIGESGDKEDDI